MLSDRAKSGLIGSIEHGDIVKDFIQHEGYNILNQYILDKVDELNAKIEVSTDSGAIMCAVKEKQGVMYVKQVLVEIIQKGKEAQGKLESTAK
jgi:hypothetical protein